mmetsp:Transcript_16147/g.21112  ORF Transcript_16147/g.21112 Transcript_16147/m.21112 type:complete len:489 (-) Transcript_16147:23-1489(-)
MFDVVILAFFLAFVGAIYHLSGAVYSAEPTKTQPGNLQTLEFLSSSNTVCFPKGIHLSQATNVQRKSGKLDVTVSFLLDQKNEECNGVIPAVAFGRQAQKEERLVSAKDLKPLQFNHTQSLSNGLFESPWIYHVKLPNLVGGSERYWYKILLLEKQDNSLVLVETKRHFFWTPPLMGQPTTLALVGDLGQTENSVKTMQHMMRASLHPSEKHPVTQVLIPGDLAYAHSDPKRWLSFFDIMEPFFQSILLQVAAGNHEFECDIDNFKIWVPYEHYFRVPNQLGPADVGPTENVTECPVANHLNSHYLYGNSFYSYQHGLAKIIVLNSFTDSTAGSVQYRFLEEELQKAQKERHEIPWVIIAFHSPLYNTFDTHIDEKPAVLMKQAMEPLFMKYKVNFIVCGHDHAYLRTAPIFNDTMTPYAPIHLTLGAGGNDEGHVGFRDNTSEPWVVKRDISEYGYGHLFLPNSTHAKFTWVRDGTTDMGIHDTVWL